MSYTAESFKPIYQEMMKVLQKKYNHMTEVCKLTVELEEGLNRNDRVSAQMLLSMRQEELEGIKVCDRDLQLYVDSLPQEVRHRLEEIINARQPSGELECNEEKIMLRIATGTRREWEKTVTIDKVLNRKIVGEKNSYSGSTGGRQAATGSV
jgi:hypothetical protein